jgi:carboxyl-terminal processing protease
VFRFSRRRFYSALGVLGAFLLSLHWVITSYQPSTKSLNEYWLESGVQDADLQALIQDSLCQSSERHFLACMSSLKIVLLAKKRQIDFKGRVSDLNPEFSLDGKGERKGLTPWQDWIREDALRLYSISFEKILNQELASWAIDSQRSAVIGKSMNAYLSILKDPHTYLLPAKYYLEVLSQPQTKSFSFGLNLAQVDNGFVLRKIQKNSQADKAGLQKGDRILKVNQRSVLGLPLDQVIEDIKSRPQSSLRLLVERKGRKIQVVLQRKSQANVSVTLDELPGAPSVGLLSIHKFANKTCDLVKEQIQSSPEKVKAGLILDLRDNPGGAVEQAACVASLFLGPQKLFTYHYLDRRQADEDIWGTENTLYQGPLSILVNAGTASAAELLAGTLRAQGRASLVGNRTFGKGSFQDGEVWSKNSRLLYFKTLGLYYLPNGETPQVIGLQPDVLVKDQADRIDREADLYMYPLQGISASSAKAKNQLNLSRCLSKSSEVEGSDPELAQAISVLDCDEKLRRSGQLIAPPL